jgi:hypothetical protein
MVVRTLAYRRSSDTNFLAKTPPPYTLDGVARDRFVPVLVVVNSAKGAARALVRFGYAENGPSENFYCTSRQEACIAVDTLGQRSGQLSIAGGTVRLQSGDPFDAETWKAGTKIQIMGSEWALSTAPTMNTLTIGSQAGPGYVSANGSVVYFSNPGECVKHTIGTHIIANGTTVIVTDPWQCDGTANGNHVVSIRRSVGRRRRGHGTPATWAATRGRTIRRSIMRVKLSMDNPVLVVARSGYPRSHSEYFITRWSTIMGPLGPSK